MLKSFALYGAILGGALAVASVCIHLLLAHQLRLALPARLTIMAHEGEEALERAPRGAPLERALASVLDAPDEGLAWFDARGTLVGKTGMTETQDAAVSKTRVREELVDGWIQATISNRRVTAALQQLDLGLTFGTIVAILAGGCISTAISMRAVGRVEAVLQRVHRFTGDAAHELRTPLAVIANNADRLALDPCDDAGRDRSLENIRQAAGQMRTLMDGLLMLARADEGVVRDLHAIDVGACVEAVAATYRADAAARGLTLTVEAPAYQTIYGQPEQVARILGNLIENALRYTAAGGAIAIAGRTERHAAVVEVGDTGVGIAPADLDRVFDRFWRADGPRTGTGSGLGLAIARGLARAHGGDVWAKSRPGVGSTFTVRLPSQPPRSAAVSTVSRP
jgi:OmpR-family two-component system manganese-sensing sensor histidine kinase